MSKSLLLGSIWKKGNVGDTCCATPPASGGTFAVDNGLSIVGGKAGLGDNDVAMTRDVNLKGQENGINWYEEFVDKDCYVTDPNWNSYSEFWMNTENTGFGYRAKVYQESYSELSGGPYGAHKTDIWWGTEADFADTDVSKYYFNTRQNNNATYTNVNSTVTIRNNKFGKYFDLWNNDSGAANTLSMGLRLGGFADDTTPGVYDSNAVMYYNTTTNKLRAKEGGVWKDVINAPSGATATALAVYVPFNEPGNDGVYKYSDYVKFTVHAHETLKVDLSIPFGYNTTDSSLSTIFQLTGVTGGDIFSDISMELQMFGDGASLKRALAGASQITNELAWSTFAGYQNTNYHILKITGTITNTNSTTDALLTLGFKAVMGYSSSIYTIPFGAGGTVTNIGTWVP